MRTYVRMIVTALIPLFPLRIAVIEARVAWDDPIALGPAPGDAQVIGACTTAAWDQGVRPGLRVGEALARCPGLDLVTPHPDAVRVAVQRQTLGATGWTEATVRAGTVQRLEETILGKARDLRRNAISPDR